LIAAFLTIQRIGLILSLSLIAVKMRFFTY